KTMGFDDAVRMISCVDVAYRNANRMAWVMSDQDRQKVRMVSDGFGHPLWQPSVQVGEPDRIEGYPIVVDNNTSTTGAANSYGPLFGDFKTAMVLRRVNQAAVMALHERYADNLQVGYLGFCRYDSRSNDLRAAIQFQNAAS